MGHAKRGDLKATLSANKLSADQQGKNNTLPIQANSLFKSFTRESIRKNPHVAGRSG